MSVLGCYVIGTSYLSCCDFFYFFLGFTTLLSLGSRDCSVGYPWSKTYPPLSHKGPLMLSDYIFNDHHCSRKRSLPPCPLLYGRESNYPLRELRS